MTWGILILIITAYLTGAYLAAPRLMRLIYEDRLAIQTERRTRHEQELEEWKQRGRTGYRPIHFDGRSNGDIMRGAREDGAWAALAWPIALPYWSLGQTAFKQEIAASQAAKNQRIIADYDQLLHQRFGAELSTAHPTKSGLHWIRNVLKEKK